MDSEQLSKLPEIIRSIVLIDRKLDELRKAPIVRLSPEFANILRYRRNLVNSAHEKWGRQDKGK